MACKLRANSGSVVARPLADLLAVTDGPLPLLTQALPDLPGIDHADIYGSWAARHEGHPGGMPKDVDVLVVGSADRDDLADAVGQVASRLRREVNVRRVQPSGGPRWIRSSGLSGPGPWWNWYHCVLRAREPVLGAGPR
ncbi:MAG: hypothetical protein ACYC90_14420 [Candidatus Nanopelagicales bacterium]